MHMTVNFPLSAIVGHETLIEGLLVNAVDPTVGGVLVRGERGTAKSTAVRALAPLLPPVLAAVDQPFAFAPGELSPGGLVPLDATVAQRAAPLVELPLGATLDRLLGSLDLGRALAGEQAFEAGLLARAHQGILYVDEVNLLPDHLVDALLDAAASGFARVEREAVSASHASRFLLVGTMNAEEGELRPQLLDRFGLSVTIAAPQDPATRSEIVRRRLAFEADPESFVAEWSRDEAGLARQIAAARDFLPKVWLPERELHRITSACAELDVEGVRGDIVCARAARVLAALDQIESVTDEHVRRAARLALAHRRRHDPLDGHQVSDQDIERALDGGPPDDEPLPPRPGRGRGRDQDAALPGDGSGTGSVSTADQIDERLPARERFDAPAEARMAAGALRLDAAGGGPAGRRARARGRTTGAIDSRPASEDSDDLSIVGSLRDRLVRGSAAALSEHIRAGREGVLLCLVVDASGSMGARRRLAKIKGALLRLLREAHVHRDRVALITFRDGDARVLLEPSASLDRAASAIRSLSAGGLTPLASGLVAAEQLIARARMRDPSRRAVAVILTDGRVPEGHAEIAASARRLGRAAAAVSVIDAEDGAARLGFAHSLARAAGGRVYALDPTPRSKGAA